MKGILFCGFQSVEAQEVDTPDMVKNSLDYKGKEPGKARET
jgi:hypothetical protein